MHNFFCDRSISIHVLRFEPPHGFPFWISIWESKTVIKCQKTVTLLNNQFLGVWSHSKMASLFEAQELHHEEEVLRNPYHLKSWLSYLLYKKDASPLSRYLIFERALVNLPRSYKLWFAYLMERKNNLKKKSILDKGYKILVNTFERSIVHMNKMPRIW